MIARHCELVDHLFFMMFAPFLLNISQFGIKKVPDPKFGNHCHTWYRLVYTRIDICTASETVTKGETTASSRSRGSMPRFLPIRNRVGEGRVNWAHREQWRPQCLAQAVTHLNTKQGSNRRLFVPRCPLSTNCATAPSSSSICNRELW